MKTTKPIDEYKSLRYLEETRSTLQFASRAKLVVTNATVNEVMDEGAKLRKLTKELNALKEKQKGIGMGEAEYARLEAEKNELLNRLFAMETERNMQMVRRRRRRPSY
jgi:centromeric protein E